MLQVVSKLGIKGHQKIGLTEAGPQFKLVSSDRLKKQGIGLWFKVSSGRPKRRGLSLQPLAW